MPGFIKPQLATLKSKAPKGGQWLHEIKFDGYRIQVHINRGRKKVFTRNGLDWTKRFSVIAGALDIPGETIIDGEVVVTNEGRTNFSELQAELAAGRQDRLVYSPSTFCGVTGIFVIFLKSSASKRCWTSSAKTTTLSRRYSTQNISLVMDRRCLNTPRS
jgi:ATP dependent DNA ligase domain